MPCLTCRHRKNLHDGACRVTGCPCYAYADPQEQELLTTDRNEQVTFEIPPGFALTVQLVPILPEATDVND